MFLYKDKLHPLRSTHLIYNTEVVEAGGLTNSVEVCVLRDEQSLQTRQCHLAGLECCHTRRLTAIKLFWFWNGYTAMIFSQFVNFTSSWFGNTAEHSPSDLSCGGRGDYQWDRYIKEGNFSSSERLLSKNKTIKPHAVLPTISRYWSRALGYIDI